MKWKADREKLLNRFATEVASNNYYKIEYPRWRELSRSTMPYLIIDRELKTAEEVEDWHVTFNVICNPGKEDEFCLTFQYCDNSMGEFIGDHFQDPDLSFGCDKKEIDNVNDKDWFKQYAVKYDTNTASSHIIDGSITGSITGYGTSDDGYHNTITTAPYKWDTSTWVAVPNTTIDINKEDMKELIKEALKENEKDKKEKTTMDTSKMFNFDFGPASGGQFRMSPYGLAVRTAANGWVAFDQKNGNLMDVEVLNFDMSKFIYKMPVPASALKAGDIVLHAGKPVFVRHLGTGGNIVNVINYADATVVDIMPVKSPFGFDFFTKICSLVDFSQMNANSDNPFGNMLPFLLMGDGKDIDPMMFLFMGGNMNFSNPMMLYFLMNQKDKSDMLPFLMMMNGGQMFGNPPTNITPAQTQGASLPTT